MDAAVIAISHSEDETVIASFHSEDEAIISIFHSESDCADRSIIASYRDHDYRPQTAVECDPAQVEICLSIFCHQRLGIGTLRDHA